MASTQRSDRLSQWLICFGGIALLWSGVNAALKSYSLGLLVFSYRKLEFTGGIGGFLIAACLLLGAGLLGTAVRNLERS